MILDLRTYTTKPGRTAEWVKLYKEHAWPLQLQYLERCVAWTTSTEGMLNQVVHIWAYDSQADREARRTAMAKDPGWAKYLAVNVEAGLLVSMENRILTPAEFSPLK